MGTGLFCWGTNMRAVRAQEGGQIPWRKPRPREAKEIVKCHVVCEGQSYLFSPGFPISSFHWTMRCFS